MVVPSLSFDCPHRPRSGSCGSHCRSRYSFRGVHSLHPSLHGRMYTTVSSDPMAPRPSVSEDANAGSTTLNVSDGRSRLPQGRRPSRSSTGCRHGPCWRALTSRVHSQCILCISTYDDGGWSSQGHYAVPSAQPVAPRNLRVVWLISCKIELDARIKSSECPGGRAELRAYLHGNT